jgi:hypothetical protein
VSKNSNLPEKVDPYWTVGGSGEPEDFTAIALFETPNGEHDAVIGFTLKNIPEVSGFVSFIAEKFGSENRYKVAMLELPMIYWSNGTQETEDQVLLAVENWIAHEEDPTEVFYDCLENFEFESFYSEYEEALKHPLITISKKQLRAAMKKSKGFG